MIFFSQTGLWYKPNMNERKRLAFLAANYHSLQTLRFAPVFAFLVVGHWWPADASIRSDRIALGVVLSICILWYWLLNAFYQQRYGRVETTRFTERPDDKSEWIFLLIIPLAYLLIHFGKISSDFGLLWIPLYIFYRGITSPNLPLRRGYHFAAGVFLLVVIFLSMIPGMDGHQMSLSLKWVSIGAVLLLRSILDHILLMHCFRQVPLENNV